ncbi:MAG: hypothetical protein HKN79_00540, partial [Flavobacteriales bacterium]|nr:hypothetical protein [Flavobacteriales bacterium]
YSELTDTLRAYLEGRYGVPALEQTSKEIMQDIRYKGLSSEDQDYLQSLLFTSDMVKFAKENPSSSVAVDHLERAFRFIERTRPVAEQHAEQEDSNTVASHNMTSET